MAPAAVHPSLKGGVRLRASSVLASRPQNGQHQMPRKQPTRRLSQGEIRSTLDSLIETRAIQLREDNPSLSAHGAFAASCAEARRRFPTTFPIWATRPVGGA